MEKEHDLPKSSKRLRCSRHSFLTSNLREVLAWTVRRLGKMQSQTEKSLGGESVGEQSYEEEGETVGLGLESGEEDTDEVDDDSVVEKAEADQPEPLEPLKLICSKEVMKKKM